MNMTLYNIKRFLFSVFIGASFTLFFMTNCCISDLLSNAFNSKEIGKLEIIVKHAKSLALFDFFVGLALIIVAILLRQSFKAVFIRQLIIFCIFWTGTSIAGGALYRLFFTSPYYVIIGENGLKSYSFKYKNVLWSEIQDIHLIGNTKIIVFLTDNRSFEIYGFRIDVSIETLYESMKKNYRNT